MEKVFSSPDEEGHLLSSSSLSTHRLTPAASSGLLLNSAAAYLLLFIDSRVVGPGLHLLLTCAFGLNLALGVVFHILMEFCMTALVDPVQIQAIQSVCQATSHERPCSQRLVCLALQSQTTALSTIGWCFLRSQCTS